MKAAVGTCRDAQTYLHFVSSRGAYASAMEFLLLNSAGDSQVTSSCKLMTPGGSGQVKNCLKYTGECSAQLSPVTACLGDSQTQGGRFRVSARHRPSSGHSIGARARASAPTPG